MAAISKQQQAQDATNEIFRSLVGIPVGSIFTWTHKGVDWEQSSVDKVAVSTERGLLHLFSVLQLQIQIKLCPGLADSTSLSANGANYSYTVTMEMGSGFEEHPSGSDHHHNGSLEPTLFSE